jgi:hypothetical protein
MVVGAVVVAAMAVSMIMVINVQVGDAALSVGIARWCDQDALIVVCGAILLGKL